jgi:hypothetical protein
MDLLYHFIGGALIALAIILLAKNTKDKTLLVAAFLSLGAGLFKEIVIDLWLRNVPMELADVTLTWSGGLAVLFAIKIIEVIRTKDFHK